MGWDDTFQTILVLPTGATSGERIVLDGTTGLIDVYDANGNLSAQIDPNASTGPTAAKGGAFISDGTSPSGTPIIIEMANGRLIAMDPSAPTTSPGGLTADNATVLAGYQVVLEPVALAGSNAPLIYLQSETSVGAGDDVGGITADTITLEPRTQPGPLALQARANLLLTGTAIKASGNSYTQPGWQTPAYNANWAAATTFNGIAGLTPLQFRLDVEDNVTVVGTFAAGATLPSTAVFNLPAAYRPKKQVTVEVQRNSAGTLATGRALITTGGNFDLFSNMGVPPVASAEYQVCATFPLSNLA